MRNYKINPVITKCREDGFRVELFEDEKPVGYCHIPVWQLQYVSQEQVEQEINTWINGGDMHPRFQIFGYTLTK